MSKSLVIDLKTRVLSRYRFVEVDRVVTPILDIRSSRLDSLVEEGVTSLGIRTLRNSI